MGGTNSPGEVWGQGLVSLPGLEPVLLFFFFCLFLTFSPWKTSACCSLMSAWLYCHLLQMSNSVGLADNRPPSAASSSAIACQCGAPSPENARAGRSPAGRMGHLCTAESCLVPCEGGSSLTVAAGGALAARAVLGRERLAPQILCRLPVFLSAASRKHGVSSFCQWPRTCPLSAGCGEGDSAEPQARGLCGPWR